MENCKKLYEIRKNALEEAKRKSDYKEKIRLYEEETIYNPPEDKNAPEILKKLRSVYKGNTIEYLNDLYFETLEKIQKADNENNISELLLNCQLSLGFIEPLICYNYKHYNSFNIKGIPAIYKGLAYYSINGIIGQIKNIADIVYFFDELKFNRKYVEEAYEMLKLTPKIYGLISKDGDIQQSKIKKKLNYENGQLITSTVNYMVNADRLAKYKIGRNIFVKIK